MVLRSDVEAWVGRYERTWRTAGTATLGELFTVGASYRQSPFAERLVGLAAIAEMWEAEREGADEPFTMASDVVALDGDVAVVHVHVTYGKGFPHEFRDLWVIHFAGDGRCTAFEEWPFWPGQPIAPGVEDVEEG